MSIKALLYMTSQVAMQGQSYRSINTALLNYIYGRIAKYDQSCRTG